MLQRNEFISAGEARSGVPTGHAFGPLVSGSFVADRSAKIREIGFRDWDNLLNGFQDTSWEQTAVLAEERWGTQRTTCLVVERSGQIVGGACLIIIRLPLVPYGVAFAKYGPVCRRCDSPTNTDSYRLVVAKLVDWAQQQGHALLLAPRPCPDTLQSEVKTLRELGFTTGRENLDPNRYVVNAALDEEDQRKSLGQKWRRNLRRSLKEELTVKRDNSAAGFRAFAALHADMIKRKHLACTDPIAELPEMRRSLPNRPTLEFFLAYHRDRPVAGAIVMIGQNCACYLYGASCDSSLKLNAGYAVQWSILEYLRERGIRWYDLEGEAGAEGLIRFKKGLVGKEGVVLRTPGEFMYCGGLKARAVCAAVLGARDASRWLSAIAKRLRGR